MKKSLSFIALALSAIATAHASELTQVPPPEPSTLTRAEVQQDLNAWRAADLPQEWHGQITPDTSSSAYRAKLRVYQHSVAQADAKRGTASK